MKEEEKKGICAKENATNPTGIRNQLADFRLGAVGWYPIQALLGYNGRNSVNIKNPDKNAEGNIFPYNTGKIWIKLFLDFVEPLLDEIKILTQLK